MVGVLLVGGEALSALGLDGILPPATQIGLLAYVSSLGGAYVARERFWWPALAVLAAVWLAVAYILFAMLDAMEGLTVGELLLYNVFGVIMSAVCVLAGVGSGILLARRSLQRGVSAPGR